MTEPSTAQASQPPAPAIEPGAGPHETVWQRLQRHKVLQWTLAYAAAAYTVLHATQMVVESFDWPHIIVRLVALGLVLALPVVVLLAWYHGHRAQHRISTGELSILTVLLLIAGTVMWGFTRARAPAVSTPTAVEPAASVAVVPFENLSGDPSKDYFGYGMAGELINALANVPGLKVPSRTSSFAYKGHDIDVRRIARDLGVAKILEGSVEISGDKVRVTAELVDAQSGYHLWSQPYERKFGDIFALQDELAKAIVEQLLGKIGATSADSGIKPPPTQNVEAYQLYLQADAVQRGSEETEQRAIALYGQALERDPRFARAWAGRSMAWALLTGSVQPQTTALQNAERDARQALTLDPTLAEAHEALGLLSAARRNWLEAEMTFRAALAAEAGDPGIQALFASAVLSPTGRLNEARSHILEAYRLAPADPLPNAMLAIVDSYLGSDAEAVKHADLAVSLGVTPALRASIYAAAADRSGNYQGAADQLVQSLTAPMRDAGGAEVIKQVYSALAEPKKKPAAIRALAEFVQKLGPNGITDPFWQTIFVAQFVRLDALDPAYDLTNQLANSGAGRDIWRFLWLPEMRPFRSDPRFQELVARLNFLDYWKQYGPPDECDLHGDVLVCR